MPLWLITKQINLPYIKTKPTISTTVVNTARTGTTNSSNMDVTSMPWASTDTVMAVPSADDAQANILQWSPATRCNLSYIGNKSVSWKENMDTLNTSNLDFNLKICHLLNVLLLGSFISNTIEYVIFLTMKCARYSIRYEKIPIILLGFIKNYFMRYYRVLK